MSTKQELATRLKEYAEAHYNEGWDTFVECYDNEDYLEFVGDMTTWKEVKEFALRINDVIDDRRADAAHHIREGG